MSNGASNQGDWPPGPALVALGILLLVGAITISAIVHYNSVDDALKIWSGLTAIVGVITGAFVSFFFTRSTVQTAQQGLQAAQQGADIAQQTAQRATEEAASKSKALEATLALITDPTLRDEVMAHPAVESALRPDS